jgi:sugar phosphate permease
MSKLDAAVLDEVGTRPSRLPQARWILACVLFITVISAFFDRISISVLFTNTDFQNAMGTGFNPTLLGLLMTSFLFAYGLSSAMLSFVGDVFGPRKCLAAGAVIWAILMACMGSAGSFGLMLTYRVLLGVFEGPQYSLIGSLVKRWFPPGERARATSIWMVASPLGSMIGFPVTIFLVAGYGWRMSFFVLAAINLLLILPLVLLFVRDAPPGGPVAVEAEKRASYRESVSLFIRDWRFWMIVISTSGSLTYLWGLNSWLPSYLVKVHSVDLQQATLFASMPFFLMFVGELAGAFIADRTGRSAVVSGVSLFLAGVVMYFVPRMHDAQSASMLIGVSTFFWGACTPTKNALALSILPLGAVATGVGLYNGIGNLVGSLSPVAMGALIGATGSYETGFMVIIASSIIGSMALVPLMFAGQGEAKRK